MSGHNCVTFGHKWDHTTSDKVRKCDFCNAKQVRVNGVWTTPPRINKLRKQKTVPPNQMQMF